MFSKVSAKERRRERERATVTEKEVEEESKGEGGRERSTEIFLERLEGLRTLEGFKKIGRSNSGEGPRGWWRGRRRGVCVKTA